MTSFEEHIYKTTIVKTSATFTVVPLNSLAKVNFGTSINNNVKFKITLNGIYEHILSSNNSLYGLQVGNLIPSELYNTNVTVKVEPYNGRNDLSEIIGIGFDAGSNNRIYFNTDIADFKDFPSLTSLGVGTTINTNGNIYGDLADMPRTLVTFQYQGELIGNGEDLPENLKIFTIRNSYAGYNPTFIIDTNTLPIGLTNLGLNYANVQISGNIVDLENIVRLAISSVQGTEGSLIVDLNNLPSSLVYISIGSSGVAIKAIGDIENLHEGLQTFTLQTMVSADSFLTGNIGNFPSTLQNFHILNIPNDITGDWATLPESLYYIYIDGDNTIYGDIGTSKDALLHVYLYGLNALSGLIQNCLTKNRSVLDVRGLNNLSGDWGLCYMIPNTVRIYGENIISDFTYPNSVLLGGGSFQFRIGGNCNLNTTEIDNFLIMIDDNYSASSSSRTIEILGDSSPRSSASDIAYNSLISKNFTITLNT